MTRDPSKPADVVLHQHATIARAVDLLREQLERMTDEVNPDTCDWATVSRFAKVHGVALSVIEELEAER